MEEKILIKDILEMKKELTKLDGEEKDYYRNMWKVFERYAEKIPRVKLSLGTLNNKFNMLKKIFKRSLSPNSNNYNKEERKLLYELYYCNICRRAHWIFEVKPESCYKDIVLISSKFAEAGLGHDVIKYGDELSDNEAKDIIMSLPSSGLIYNRMTTMSLEEILRTDDLLDFIDDEKLKVIQNNNLYGLSDQKTENEKKRESLVDLRLDFEDNPSLSPQNIFSSKIMQKFGRYIFEREIVLNDLEYAQKAVKFYYQNLPNIISSGISEVNRKYGECDNYGKQKDKKYDKLKDNCKPESPSILFAYKLLKKYKEKNDVNFDEFKKYVQDIIKDIFLQKNSGYKTIKDFCKLKDMLERRETSNLEPSEYMSEDPNNVYEFLYTHGIITRAPKVSKTFYSMTNFKYDCTWGEWWNELCWCIRNKLSMLFKKSYNITNAVCLRKFLARYNSTTVTLNSCVGENNHSNKEVTASKLLEIMGEFVPELENKSDAKKASYVNSNSVSK